MRGPRQHDWETIAKRDPYFGVLTWPEMHGTELGDAARELFYKTGEGVIDEVMAFFDADLDARPKGRALDFGCGLGRLTFAMAKRMEMVVGRDVSEAIVAKARETAPANVTLTTGAAAGPFDWINSFIVFQHIPPAEGLELLKACLAEAGPGCFLSLQVTAWQTGEIPKQHPAAKMRRWLTRLSHRRAGQDVAPLIRMYTYDFSAVFRVLAEAGFTRVVMRHTQHGDHHGAWFIGRRGAGA